MGAPNFFGTAAVFWPGPIMHPEDDGEGYSFCETTPLGQDGEPDAHMRYYNPDSRYTARTLQELEDLMLATRWAYLHCLRGHLSLHDRELDADMEADLEALESKASSY